MVIFCKFAFRYVEKYTRVDSRIELKSFSLALARLSERCMCPFFLSVTCKATFEPFGCPRTYSRTVLPVSYSFSEPVLGWGE